VCAHPVPPFIELLLFLRDKGGPGLIQVFLIIEALLFYSISCHYEQSMNKSENYPAILIRPLQFKRH
jgi:hypothetical protein